MKTQAAISQFAALSHELRYRAFRLLIDKAPDEISAGTLSNLLQAKPSTLSPHLARLDSAGLVTSRREGTHIFYRIQIEQVTALIDHLVKDCCGGNPSICIPSFEVQMKRNAAE